MFVFERLGSATSLLGQAPAAPRLSVVQNPRAIPFRSVCYIHVRTLSGGHSVGTGLLIGPHHLLTCAHILYDHRDPRPRSVTVAPAEDGKAIPSNGWAVAPSWRWNDCRTRGDDLAIVRLARPARAAPWALTPFDPARLLNATVDLTGYVASATDPAVRTLQRSRGRVSGAIRIEGCTEPDKNRKGSLWGSVLARIEEDTKLVKHDLPSHHSMSGGPICALLDGQLRLVALHASDEASLKTAVLLGAPVRAWIASSQRQLSPLA